MQATSQEHALLTALMVAGRRLRARATDGRFDPAAVWVLHQVHQNGVLRVSDLAGCAGLDVSTVSRHVRSLEDLGYLHRTSDPADRRAARVALTDSGRSLLADAMAARSAVVADVLATWSAEDRETLTRLLSRFVEALDAPAAPAPAPSPDADSLSVPTAEVSA